jgi:hypothetical protein
MPLPFRPDCLPAGLGVLPHTTSRLAWDSCTRYFPTFLPLPLLTSEGEDPATLAIDGFPGATIALDQPRFDRNVALAEMEPLYAAYLQHRWESRAVLLQALDEWPQREREVRHASALTVVLMGPISASLRLVDDDALPLLGDEVMLDALAKHLALRMEWYRMTLGRSTRVLLQWLYEPYLSIVASPFSPVDWAAARELLAETFGTPGSPPHALRGVWTTELADIPALLEGTLVEALSVPIPEPPVLETWAPALLQFIRRKGVVGWRIVPHTPGELAQTRVGRIAARFSAMLQVFEGLGIAPGEVAAASMIMPEDALGYLYPAEADAVLALTHQVSGLLRHSYGLD